MFRRRLLPFAGVLALTTSVSLHQVHEAHATTAILPSDAAAPLDQRIAIAISPSRTTIWTNLRLDTGASPVGLVVPVPPGAALDHSSDAWFEALDEATAPRVFPPSGVSYVCPGTSPDPANDPFHVTTYPVPISSIAPIESKVLLDVPSVIAWANANGFSMSPATSTALEGMSGMRFFVERFNPQSTPFFSSTLRVVLPGSTPVLPLALTRAGTTDLRITAWFIGAGRATLTGSSPLKLQMTDLQWIAQTQTSNYDKMRDAALVSAGFAATVTETSSHDALVKNIPIASGKGSITGVVTGYFQRAAKYLDGNANSDPCILSAGVTLDNTLDVAQVCPRADLGVVDGGPTCIEAPSGSEVDPDKLRCGGRADDLAVALSDLRPSSTWLTRLTMFVPKNASGQSWPITFASAAPQVDPTETASNISFSGCGASGTSSSSSSGSTGNGATGSGSTSGGPWTTTGSGGGGSPTTYTPEYEPDMACGCVGAAVDPDIIDDTSYGGNGGSGGSGGDTYYDSSTSDDCDGSTTDSTDPAYDDSSTSDDCDGSTTDSTDTSTTSDEGIDCSGDTSGDGGSSGSGGTTDTTDSSDSSDCAVARAPRAKPHNKRGPKASVMTLGLLAILAPLRRWRRPQRTRRAPQDKLVMRRAART